MLNNQISKDYENLTLSNNFIFMKVMQDKRLCIRLLEIILNKKIRDIKYQTQKEFETAPDSKGIRLDVYVEGSSEVYDLEMQSLDTNDLKKRSRYYQGKMDVVFLEKGTDVTYNDLKDSYIIFICTFDLFEKGRHIYRFTQICQEDKNIILNDGTERIFLNPHSELDDIDEKLSSFLKYLIDEHPRDDFTERLDKSVKKARKNKKWRDEYMTVEMQNRIIRAQGKAEGKAEGIAEFSTVIDRINAGETAKSIISSGIDETTVNKAVALVNKIVSESTQA